jgi:hypothetical protein
MPIFLEMHLSILAGNGFCSSLQKGQKSRNLETREHGFKPH